MKHFYRAARQILYPLIFRGDGVGGILSHVFLYKAKRRSPDFTDCHLHGPGIDLQELRNWGCKGVIFGDCNDLDLEVVPFQIKHGGRIKRFGEDKIVDIINNDKMDFCQIKNVRITRYNVYWEHVVEKPIAAVIEKAGDQSFKSTDGDDESMITVRSGGEVARIETILEEERWEQVLGQVTLKMARMQLENVECTQKGKDLFPLDNVTKFNLFFQLSKPVTSALATSAIEVPVRTDESFEVPERQSGEGGQMESGAVGKSSEDGKSGEEQSSDGERESGESNGKESADGKSGEEQSSDGEWESGEGSSGKKSSESEERESGSSGKEESGDREETEGTDDLLEGKADVEVMAEMEEELLGEPLQSSSPKVD